MPPKRQYCYICAEKRNDDTQKTFPSAFPSMAITFILKNKAAANSYIQIAVRFRGQLYKKSTGETIPVKYWNAKKHRCSITRDFPRGLDVNDVLSKMEAAGNETVSFFRDYSGVPAAPAFWEKFDSIYYKGSNEKVYFVDYLNAYIEKIRAVRGESTVKKYITAANKLAEYEQQTRRYLLLSDINIDFYNRFQAWLYSQGFSANYFGSLIKNIKHVIREANYEGLCDLKGIEHRDFVTINEKADSIYLNEDELRRIYELEITPESVRAFFGDELDAREETAKRKAASMRIIRNRFIIGAFTGLRVSDYGRLSEANLTGNTIRIKTAKTGANVVIPIHPYVRAVLSSTDLDKRVSDQKINKHIKEIARMAGIDEEVTINRNIGGRNVQETHKKYELVCSHTARRSFATNAYKAGVPTIAIMKITGHTKESTFLKYIKVSAEENAAMLAEHPFFKAK